MVGTSVFDVVVGFLSCCGCLFPWLSLDDPQAYNKLPVDRELSYPGRSNAVPMGHTENDYQA